MKPIARIALLALLVACGHHHDHGSTPPPPPGGGGGGGGGSDGSGTTPAPAAVDPAQLGVKCGEGDKCLPPTECVKYYGIAGANGPQFATCEIRCGKESCPEHTTCRTIADGPGSVCRPETAAQ